MFSETTESVRALLARLRTPGGIRAVNVQGVQSLGFFGIVAQGHEPIKGQGVAAGAGADCAETSVGVPGLGSFNVEPEPDECFVGSWWTAGEAGDGPDPVGNGKVCPGRVFF